VLSGTGSCDGPIPRPEKSYRMRICVSNWVWSGATAILCIYNEQVEKSSDWERENHFLLSNLLTPFYFVQPASYEIVTSSSIYYTTTGLRLVFRTVSPELILILL
jgi:hypothetical protein